ncbi:MAG: Restriction endonuclease [Candidatus Hydrogenedentes bacterium ADurb.Bin101]|jgi:uncharacterized LabA/DUF88 family protein|nr:MAG: Restriction endonuclease [Candidatus Hydrogenedentes bacterium ADurb.Bin101]
MISLPDYWPLILLYGGPLLIGIGFGLGHATRNVIARKRIQNTLQERDEAFLNSHAQGRQWLADFIAEARAEIDKQLEDHLRYKPHPARKSAEVVKDIRKEKRYLQSRLTFLEYQLRAYEEYFPFLEEYRDAILDDRFGLSAQADNIQQLESIDPVHLLLGKDEFDQLSTAQRNQLALDRYLSRSKSNWEIGRLYERYIGYLYESRGWKVVFNGAIKGFEDFGRDLICTCDGKTEVVQAKCWSREKVIREKHIFQLFGTYIHFRKGSIGNVVAVFITTTELSPEAIEVAEALGIRVDRIPLTTDYPMIKCNISGRTREKIYHLPFDQQYDRVVIGDRDGEFYAATIEEAEAKGFRRAWRYVGEQAGRAGMAEHTTKPSSVRRTHRR